MFSHEGLPMKAETLEYAWLIEVVVGDLVGRLTTPQVACCCVVFLLGCAVVFCFFLWFGFYVNFMLFSGCFFFHLVYFYVSYLI